MDAKFPDMGLFDGSGAGAGVIRWTELAPAEADGWDMPPESATDNDVEVVFEPTEVVPSPL